MNQDDCKVDINYKGQIYWLIFKLVPVVEQEFFGSRALKKLATFRLEYEIEYKYDFSNLVRMF